MTTLNVKTKYEKVTSRSRAAEATTELSEDGGVPKQSLGTRKKRTKRTACATGGKSAARKKVSGAAEVSQEKGKVLRLRLGRGQATDNVDRLASAQDDGGFVRGLRAERQEGIPVAALPPGLGTAPATTELAREGGTEAETPGNEMPEERKKRRAREISAKYQAELKADLAARRAEQVDRPNPLLMLEEEQSAKLFVWLRECPYNDAVKQMLADQGITGVTDAELNEFFESEARMHWERRLQRAATEANALVSYVEQNPVKFSAGILAALGQEAFRQIASGEVAPEAMARMTNLFLKARADERSDQVMELRREKLELDRRTQMEAALEAFATEIEKHPAARAAFEALRAELLRKEEELS